MRKLAITLAVTTTLGLSAAAGAALPVNGPFAAASSLKPINGFRALVTFTSASGGKSLKKFTFETLGCFGVSGFYPAGTDPYGDPTSSALVKTAIPVSVKGAFNVTTTPVFADAQDTVTTAVIQGTFVSSKSAVGTITLTQTSKGDKCGPQKIKFTAEPGTPSSLGING
jgi:hypothetical protein